uniref:Hexosyltransferase n=1 Tax=Parascaris univalens TaxID=6257 RepID=A0A915CB52_PARUN
MVYGARTGVPLALGLLFGVIISLAILPREEYLSIGLCPFAESPSLEEEESSEHWQVIVKKKPPTNANVQLGKVARARFAATELGTREKLLVIILGQSSLTVALNASIGHHVPRMQLFVDASRVDADIALLPNLTPYRLNGQHAHVSILNSIFNMTLHENYDWFYVMPDTTYVNPFELMNFVNHVNWNRRVAIGGTSNSVADRKCTLQAGILLSNPAMQSLIQQRHICNSIASNSDHTAFEMCIHHATNLSCLSEYQGMKYNWWKVDGMGFGGADSGMTIHDKVSWWARSSKFNRSLSVSPLLSEADARALHEHFVNVEVGRVDLEIEQLIAEIESLSADIPDGPSWPVGVPPYSKPPNRHQVPKWEFFTSNEIFKNDGNQNVYALSGDDKVDVDEVLAAARKFAEGASGMAADLEFVQLQDGYRMFDAMRGMDYMVDLLYRNQFGEPVVHRVHLTRSVASTQLMHQVPYVKEDTDLTIVVPVGSNDEVGAVRRLLARQARLCQASAGDSRQTRIVVAVRAVDSAALRLINNDLVELRLRSSQTETMLLLLKAESHPVIAAAALDEAVDHFGQQMIYLLLSPHADIQREFLDRVRINTIKNFQVFFPMPFVEFHPQVVGLSEAVNNRMNAYNTHLQQGDIDDMQRLFGDRLSLIEKLRTNAFLRSGKQLVVHKDQGHFDRSDFSVLALYGVDYLRARSRLDAKTLLLDLSSLFLGQSDVHMMRAVEPALRLRYHTRECDPQLVDSDYARCLVSRREGIATKSQLANVLFNHNIAGSLQRDRE